MEHCTILRWLIYTCTGTQSIWACFYGNAMEMGNYGEIKELSTISTPSVGYKVGILNSDGEEK